MFQDTLLPSDAGGWQSQGFKAGTVTCRCKNSVEIYLHVKLGYGIWVDYDFVMGSNFDRDDGSRLVVA